MEAGRGGSSGKEEDLVAEAMREVAAAIDRQTTVLRGGLAALVKPIEDITEAASPGLLTTMLMTALMDTS